jgi:pimeloyl-ACP methyl ester carboxylesterase
VEEPQTALNFALVHGSGGGAWSWADVRQLLEREGHRVHAPSLSGMSDPETSLADHVDDSAFCSRATPSTAAGRR